jgi:hypothetical protein
VARETLAGPRARLPQAGEFGRLKVVISQTFGIDHGAVKSRSRGLVCGQLWDLKEPLRTMWLTKDIRYFTISDSQEQALQFTGGGQRCYLL